MEKFFKKIFPERESITKEELEMSVPYKDAALDLEDNVNLFITEDGVCKLVDRESGKVIRLGKNYEADERIVAIFQRKRQHKLEELKKQEKLKKESKEELGEHVYHLN